MLDATSDGLWEQIPTDYRGHLAGVDRAGLTALMAFVQKERRQGTVYPEQAKVFAALQSTPFEQVKAVILGQDPYHDDGQAEGLAFSVPAALTKLPPSLRNIFKEYQSDLGYGRPASGHLGIWAQNGVLLLNTCLTVRAHEPQSHAGRGWELFSDEIIKALNKRQKPLCFLLWGAPAQKKIALIDQKRHGIVQSAHPSPLSAYRGFLGSKPFSKCNEFLQSRGLEMVDWHLPEAPSDTLLF